jgi:predicted O-methyltransferase YrrM
MTRVPNRYPPGHFYSTVPTVEDAEAHLGRNAGLTLPGIELDPERQFGLLQRLASRHREHFRFPEARVADGPRYYRGNGFFGDGDGFLLFAMMREHEPRRVIEVGSGFSSALMLDVTESRRDQCSLTFIEPYPDRLRSLLRHGDERACRIIEQRAQDVPAAVFEELAESDILFIDSSHVSKVGSDVNHLFFEVLPRLARGVLIHVHDIFWPFEYPLKWYQEGRAWNECYLLRALLIGNRELEVVLFPQYLYAVDRQRMFETSPAHGPNLGGSIWLRRA